MSPYNKTDIANQALSLIAASTLLTDFASDTTPAGRLCRLYYDVSVEALLEAYPWSFAGRRVLLSTPNLTPPAFEFAYAFDLPADYLNVVSVDIVDSTWAVENRQLLTDNNPVQLKYTALVTDTATYTPLFCQTLAYVLAAKLALPIARSGSYMDRYNQLVKATLDRGEHVNSLATNESFDSENLINVRRGAAQNSRF